jgi:hypothetical protein
LQRPKKGFFFLAMQDIVTKAIFRNAKPLSETEKRVLRIFYGDTCSLAELGTGNKVEKLLDHV